MCYWTDVEKGSQSFVKYSVKVDGGLDKQ